MADSVTSVIADHGPLGQLSVRGARMHNLRNLDVDIDHRKLVVLTGPSGSGKSSLAFDTLFAEGRRQYIESLSVYARQFVRQLERPDVDLVRGLQPTVCIDQLPGAHNPRSTVATATEIYDYLRLLMARLGQASCHHCGAPIRQQSAEQILQQLSLLPESAKVMLLAPMVRGKRGRHADVLRRIRQAGLIRVRLDGQVYDLEQTPELSPRKMHDVEAVVDRIVIRQGQEARLAESVRLALDLGEGLLIACRLDSAATDAQNPRGAWVDELYSTRYACPRCNHSIAELEPRTFSFSSPYGACPQCDGLGAVEAFDTELCILDGARPLGEALAPLRLLTATARKRFQERLDPLCQQLALGWDLSWDSLTKAQRETLWVGCPGAMGLLQALEAEWSTTTNAKRLAALRDYRGSTVCTSCQGSRLRPEATAVRLGERRMDEITAMSVEESLSYFAGLSFAPQQQPLADPLVADILRRLRFLQHVGLDYLTLNRAVDSLSGGERQRVRLATCIGSGLIGCCYILDEPSIGLHPRDNQRLIQSLRQLQQQGNTVIVVEHDEAMMRQADQIIDMGPGAGEQGGLIVAQGSPQDIASQSVSLTGQYLSGRRRIRTPSRRRAPQKSKMLTLLQASANNLQHLDVNIPLGLLVCVTGVSGSGKSSLIMETLGPAVARRLGQSGPRAGPHAGLRGVAAIDQLIEIDQSPIGRSPRSNPATYVGAFDEVRKIFAATRDARQRGYRANRFSFNVAGGRCEACQGQGVRRIEMNFLPDLFVTCEECQGGRFNRATLQVRFKNFSIADVLELSVEHAAQLFESFNNLHRLLRCLADVGLGYLRLGQPSTTLSGGEAQRVKLATQLARTDTGRTLYILDEPTTGLHFEDIQRLLDVLQQLVDKGNTVLVIEHHLDVMRCADWILDLGPEGGKQGGRLVVEGPPAVVAACTSSYTGQHLAASLEAALAES